MTDTERRQALADAARWAQHAPSIFNTQPWRWHVGEALLDLFVDRSRQLRSIDLDGRQLMLSCGAALHHARTALAATGYDVVVDPFPDTMNADLVARLGLVNGRASHQRDSAALETIRRRHSDRRPFAATLPVPEQAISSMKRAAEHEDAWLYSVPRPQVPALATAAEKAATTEAQARGYQAELAQWTHRPRSAGEGVPAETVTAQVARPVRIRDFTSGGETLLHPGHGDDRFAEFLILATTSDTQLQWLRAGEATSAVWLAATAAGLVVSVMSDVIEIPEARALVRRLLDPPGYPQIVLRVGVDMQPSPPPESPRRPPDLTGPQAPR
jgi:hypothetical protein